MNALEADFDSDLAAAKKAAREAALARRAAAHGDLRNRFGANYAGDQLMRYFFSAISPAKGIPVSGFWPVKEEIDVRPLMSALHARGHPCGLPVIVAKRTPLMFRRWDPTLPLVEGRWGIPTPAEDAPEVIPELVLVPLLAFDSGGNRLGYGAGFYDRTLALLRARPDKQTLAVGVGFAAQQVDAVPCDATDEVLDWVVTEKGATCFAAPR